MMPRLSRPLALVVASVAMVGLLATVRVLQGDFVTPSAFIFRSAGELLSLRDLLEDDVARADLESLSERLALWRVGTTTELSPAGEACLPGDAGAGEGAAGPSERIVHRFEFAGTRGVSSRVYRVEYLSCGGAGGGRRIVRGSCGFGSRTRKDEKPLLGGVEPLRVLRLALRDPGVSSDLVDALREESIAFCWVEPDRTEQVPGLQRYVFVAADASPPSKVDLRYAVEYDPEADAATFARIE
jgi:hypothetical protein